MAGEEAKIVNQWNNRTGTLNVNNAAGDNFSNMLKQDPIRHWKNISVPVLVLNGTKDAQVPAAQNVAGIISALTHNSKVEKKIFKGMNHMFQLADTGATTEYSEINESINVQVLETIGLWLKKHN